MEPCDCDGCKAYRASLERARAMHAETRAVYAAVIDKVTRRVRR